VKPSVVEIAAEVGSMAKITLKGISTFHSVNFEDDDGIRFWRYHGIGPGKKTNIKVSDVKQNIVFKVLRNFPDKFPIGKPMQKRSTNEKNSYVWFCPNDYCEESFPSEEEKNLHIEGNKHTLINPQTTTDEIKMQYVKTLKMQSKCFNVHPSPNDVSIMPKEAANKLFKKMGWGLKIRKPVQRFSVKQKQYLNDAFIKGQQSGRKVSAEFLVKQMKVAVGNDNKKLFAASEYLTPQQVMSQFSQMSAKKKVATNSTDEDEYNWAEREENEVNDFIEYNTLRQNLITNAKKTIQ
jgi:hypothetical protein